MGPPLPFMLSIPHGGLVVPPEAADRHALSDGELFDESDSFTRELYGMADAVLGEVTQDVARAIVDLNRPPDELPPEVEDGAIKAATRFGRPTWRDGEAPDPNLQRTLLERYYDPYHRRLAEMLEEHRGEVRLLIDCHTMAGTGPPAAKDAGARRPLICLSNLGDETGSSAHSGRTSVPKAVLVRFREIMAEVFASEIASSDHSNPIGLNQPFLGGHITRHYSEEGLWVLQVELSKEVYLDSQWFDTTTRKMDGDRLSGLNALLRAAFAELARSPELS
jgi:N-formylglutamate deformylase